MRLTLRQRGLVPLLIAAAALAVHACRRAPDGPPAPPDPAEPAAVRVSYDSKLSGVLPLMLSRWTAAHPGALARGISDTAGAIAGRAHAGTDDADLIVLTAQTPLPEGDRAPISVRPWAHDPLVIFTPPGETRPLDEIIHDGGRLAMGVVAGPMGQYTRFGLRKIELWDAVKSHLIRHSDAASVMNAVRDGDAAVGVVYSSDLARDPDGLRRVGVLDSAESASREYVLVVLTPAGVPLARWIADPAQDDSLTSGGYLPLRPQSN